MNLTSALSALFGSRPPAVQAGALCLREGDNGLEVLLVSSLRTKRWIVPKGWPMKGKTLAEAAAIEAWEEAGVTGDLGSEPVGSFTYVKDRGARLDQLCEVHLFPITNPSLARDWPEKGARDRRWVSVQTAAEEASDAGLREFLKSLKLTGFSCF